MHVELLTPPPDPATVDGLAEVLLDCVAGGASVGFLADLTRDEAAGWWRATLADDSASTWAARLGGRVVGVVRLSAAPLPNSRHRAEVSKLLVHRSARGRGVARALLAALEDAARADGRTLLVLDTETGSPAEGIYAGWGWRRVGVIEDYAARPDGTLAPTTYMTRRL